LQSKIKAFVTARSGTAVLEYAVIGSIVLAVVLVSFRGAGLNDILNARFIALIELTEQADSETSNVGNRPQIRGQSDKNVGEGPPADKGNKNK
jgi:Flp pilus assembly pilin Flp